jgi:hypothetical protein
MANYPAIIHLRPEVRDFIRNRRWVHRGDVITYGPDISCDSFSTDSAGFRHSVFKGETLSVRGCLQSDRYGLVLGPSNVYGFGLAGNENTIPSLLAEHLGFPFGNVGLPEGSTRNLHSLLTAMLVRAPRPPAAVLLLSGGDFTNFCYTTVADPVFGSPNLKQGALVLEERGGKLPREPQIKALLAFTTLWISAIAEQCRKRRIPLVLGEDVTFFEKQALGEYDVKAELGRPLNAAQTRQFETHKKHVRDYHARRQAIASKLGLPLPGPGFGNDISYVDEFHYDREGTRALTADFARSIDSLL